MSCLWGEETCPRAVQGHRRKGCGVSRTPQVTEQVGARLTAPSLGRPSGCLAGNLVMGWLFRGCRGPVLTALTFVSAASPPW